MQQTLCTRVANYAVILAADDDENDRFFLERAVKMTSIPNPLVTARDGQEVIDYLMGCPPFTDRDKYPAPGLLLLDLKMPGMGGFDVLEWLAAQADWKHLPTVVLSSSSLPEDKERAFQLGAVGFHTKPTGTKELALLLRELHARWMSQADAPPNCSVGM